MGGFNNGNYKKYAVGICNLTNSETVVKIVECKTEIEAMIVAAEGNHMSDEMLENIKATTVEDVQQYYFDGDISVSKPVLIK